MINTKILLVRHGMVYNPRNIFYGGSVDLLLSVQGREQGFALGRSLGKQGVIPDAIATSHMLRAWEFGKILAVGLRVDSVTVDERLNDNKIPQFAGLTREQKDVFYPGKDEFDPTLPGHETRQEVLERTLQAFREFEDSIRGKTGILVSHGDPTRFLRHALLHPNEPLPSTEGMPVLGQGQAWVMETDREGRVFETGLIVPDERFFVQREREI